MRPFCSLFAYQIHKKRFFILRPRCRSFSFFGSYPVTLVVQHWRMLHFRLFIIVTNIYTQTLRRVDRPFESFNTPIKRFGILDYTLDLSTHPLPSFLLCCQTPCFLFIPTRLFWALR